MCGVKSCFQEKYRMDSKKGLRDSATNSYLVVGAKKNSRDFTHNPFPS